MALHALQPRSLLIGLLAVALLGGGYWWLRGGPESWASALLSDLEEGYVRGQPRLLVSLLDADYSVVERWPEVAAFAPTDGDDEQGQRALQRILASYFFANREAQRSMEITLHTLNALPQASSYREYEASLSIALAGSGRAHTPAISEHRFVLRRRGWLFPTLTIIDHDPLPWR